MGPASPGGGGFDHRHDASNVPYAPVSLDGAPKMPEPTVRMPEASESTTVYERVDGVVSTKELVRMSAVERSRVLRTARMEPHLQVRHFLPWTAAERLMLPSSLCVVLF